jgi:SAM-dependent methyltransferase
MAMREIGLEVVGVDLSLDLLREADAGIRARLVCADVRRLPIAGSAFDWVVNLFSSFGYFGEQGDRAVLSEIARILRPGGIAVIDLMNPDRVRAELVPHSRTRRDGYLIEEERRLEDEGRRVVKEVRQVDPHGCVRSWREDVRLYERHEIEALARDHGLQPLRVVGGFDSRALEPTAPRMILFARRSPGTGPRS